MHTNSDEPQRAAVKRAGRRAAGMKPRELRRALVDQGFAVVKGRSGHWKVTNPATGHQVCLSDTPSDRRTILNEVSRLRRIGFAG